MIATKFTNKKVYTCENSKVIADVAKKLFREMDYHLIEVIPKKSTDIKIVENLPKKVDVLILKYLLLNLLVKEFAKQSKMLRTGYLKKMD